MRRSFVPAFAILVAILAFSANSALAGGAHCKGTEGTHCLNVIKTNAEGAEVAVCGCGKEFSVTEDTPSIEYEGKRIFVCSEQCAEKVKADPAAIIPIVEQKVAEVKKEQKISGNIMSVDAEGNRIAMCSCGAEIKLGDETVTREHDGETYYFCCEKCASGFEKDAGAQVKAMHQKICDKRHKGTKEM